MPSAAQLPVFYEDVLQDIEANFRENVRRGFNNEGRLQSSRNNKPIAFRNVAFSSGEVYMSIKNLNLTTYPEFRVKKFDIDLRSACLDVNFFLGQLAFDADLQIVNKTMFENLPMVTANRIRITLNGTHATGLIGFFAVEDSFVPKNYAIEYTFETAEIEEINNLPITTRKPERSTFSYNEMSPVDVFVTELHAKLGKLLQRQLSAAIVEYSTNELLLDEEDEIRAYKEYLYQRTLQANRLADTLNDKAQRIALFKNIDLSTNFVLSYRQGVSCNRNRLRAKGTIGSSPTMTRPDEWSLHETSTEKVYFGYFSLKDLKFIYNYRTEHMQSIIQGVIKAMIYRNKFTVVLRISKGDKLPIIKLHLYELSDIEIDVSGLGSLSWLEPDVRSVVLGHIRMETRSKIVDHITRRLKETYFKMSKEIS